MPDEAIRQAEREWLTQGTYVAWRSWVNAMLRAGDERGRLLHRLARHARGYQVNVIRYMRLGRPRLPQEGEQSYHDLNRQQRLNERSVAEMHRHRRAYCRLMNETDRLGVALDFSGSVSEWASYWQDGNAPFEEKALYEVSTSTTWQYYARKAGRAAGGRDSRRRRVPIPEYNAALEKRRAECSHEFGEWFDLPHIPNGRIRLCQNCGEMDEQLRRGEESEPVGVGEET